jgi:hypothetical protein
MANSDSVTLGASETMRCAGFGRLTFRCMSSLMEIWAVVGRWLNRRKTAKVIATRGEVMGKYTVEVLQNQESSDFPEAGIPEERHPRLRGVGQHQ